MLFDTALWIFGSIAFVLGVVVVWLGGDDRSRVATGFGAILTIVGVGLLCLQFDYQGRSKIPRSPSAWFMTSWHLSDFLSSGQVYRTLGSYPVPGANDRLLIIEEQNGTLRTLRATETPPAKFVMIDRKPVVIQ